jgi:phosphoglycolate phosphatase-like HAD superfamily hydrolase
MRQDLALRAWLKAIIFDLDGTLVDSAAAPAAELGADAVINHLHELVPTLALFERRQ